MTSFPVLTFDYDFSPFGQKIRLALAASGISFSRNDQPPVLPRPTLEKLGITYRRIPVLAIGKDVYADTSLIIDVLQNTYHAVPTHPADKAFETFGIGVFGSALSIVPVAALTPEFKKDRETIFPFLNRPDYETLRPSGLADVKQQLQVIEHNFLSASSGSFVGGAKISLADVHLAWSVKWMFEALNIGKESGFGATDLPLIHKWIESLPKPQYKDVSPEEANDIILKSGYSAKDIGVDPNDPLGYEAGTQVNVESSDAKSGAHPQLGKLYGLNNKETVIELTNGIRLHFPRKGYVVRKA